MRCLLRFFFGMNAPQGRRGSALWPPLFVFVLLSVLIFRSALARGRVPECRRLTGNEDHLKAIRPPRNKVHTYNTMHADTQWCFTNDVSSSSASALRTTNQQSQRRPALNNPQQPSRWGSGGAVQKQSKKRHCWALQRRLVHLAPYQCVGSAGVATTARLNAAGGC